MAAKKNIGVIECGKPGKSFAHHSMFQKQGTVTKLYVINDAYVNTGMKNFPGAELVQDKSNLLEDHSLDLIIISGCEKQEVHLAAEVLNAGKQVQLLTERV